MSRLVVFGCSYSYGQGLPDCYIEPNMPGPTPSEFSWVSILGKNLGLEVMNLSRPGSSNLRILDTILNAEIKKDDLVIVQWSFIERGMLFLKDKKIDVGHWIKDDVVKQYYLAHTQHDLCQQTFLNMHHADLYLKSICDSYYHLMISYETLNDPMFQNKPSWFNVDYYPLNFYFLKKDKGINSNHPGLINHQIAAKFIKLHITKEKYDTKN